LIELFYRVGPSKITWSDIDGFVNRTGIQLSGWESETIKWLTDVYTDSCREFSDAQLSAPYLPRKADQGKNAEGLKSMLRRPIN